MTSFNRRMPIWIGGSALHFTQKVSQGAFLNLQDLHSHSQEGHLRTFRTVLCFLPSSLSESFSRERTSASRVCPHSSSISRAIRRRSVAFENSFWFSFLISMSCS